MTNTVKEFKNKVLVGEQISFEQAMLLYEQPLEELCKAANEIREHFCGNGFDLCTIVNGKSGKCSENCKFCSQSSHYSTAVTEYPLLSTQEFVEDAKRNYDSGILRYSIVTSGKRLSEIEVDEVCNAIKEIKKHVPMPICISLGLLDEKQYTKLKIAGAQRVHNNIETSRRNFPNVCTTHTFDDKIKAIKAAQNAGLNICSGGIMGIGELTKDRIDMAISLRELGVNSIPVNMLNPIEGTPLAQNGVLSNDDMRRIVAIYRFLLPKAAIRLAGGRGLLKDKGESCFLSGANAAISGDMLTTSGICVQDDKVLLKKIGYEVKLSNE